MKNFALEWLPAASTSADNYMAFFHRFYLPVSVVTFVGVIVAAIYFTHRYKRKRDGEQTPHISHNFMVEFLSIFLVSIAVAVLFVWGWKDYKYSITPKQGAVEINIIGKQWSWVMQYADGRTFTNELFVPAGKPVKLIMTSQDVLHSFYVPAFRTKQDTIPGQYTTLSFDATKPGEYDIFCAEFCGSAHSGMIGKIHVLNETDWKAFEAGTYKKPADKAAGAGTVSLADQGAKLFRTKTCNSCHSVDGMRLVGPSMKGVFGSERELADGSKVVADEAYIRESISEPMKKVVKGFPPAMPTFKGMLSEEEIGQIIAYIKSLK